MVHASTHNEMGMPLNIRSEEEALPLRDRLRPLQDRVMRRPTTGLEADKASYDDLCDER